MICIIRTMNPVTLSFAQAVLKDAGIESFLFDMNASVLDGSTILVRKRLMIVDEDEAEARDLLKAAGIGHELEPASSPKRGDPDHTFLSNLLRKLGLPTK
jgi:hypothetical protein